MSSSLSFNQMKQFITHKEKRKMKKLMALALGLAFVLGTVSVSFGQDTTATKAPKKAKKSKKTRKRRQTTTKK